MSASKRFRRASVTLRFPSGNRACDGFRWREFHLREELGGWIVSHLPSGFAFPACWEFKKDAAEAVVQINDLRDWRSLQVADLDTALAKKVRTIVEKTHGNWRFLTTPAQTELAKKIYSTNLNGYEART